MARILIVDDDPDVVEALEIVLKAKGHQVCSASNRQEGQDMALGEKPDLMVLDVMMEEPDDGITLAQELRRRAFARPILMLTSVGRVTGMGFDRDDDLVPVDAFLEKPVTPAVLLAKVDELLAAAKAAAKQS